ncbi:MAG: Flp/Fap pilin component [Pseudarthrobacter sp.]|nr:Flp/Fap pilin component [Pseudarthrobacter sp.]
MSTLMVSVLAFVSGIKDRLASEKGATATEYSLLIAFIAFAVIGGVTIFGTSLSDWFENLGGTVADWAGGAA